MTEAKAKFDVGEKERVRLREKREGETKEGMMKGKRKREIKMEGKKELWLLDVPDALVHSCTVLFHKMYVFFITFKI